MNNFSIAADFTEIIKYDPFDIPNGVELFDSENLENVPDRNINFSNDEEDDEYAEALNNLGNENVSQDVEQLENENNEEIRESNDV